MRFGIRGKLFVVSLLLVASVAAVSGVLLETVLRGWLEKRLQEDLQRLVGVARTAVEADPGLEPTSLQPLVKRLGRAADARMTVINSDGLVLADSAVDAGTLQNLDNHGTRPEITAAVRDGLGVRMRHSRTVGAGMLYVAVPFEHASQKGVVRVAVPLSAVDALIGRLRLAIAGAVLLGLLVAAAMGALASYFASKRLKSLVTHARTLATGQRGERLLMPTTDELAGLAGSFNRMAEEIDKSVRALGEERDRVEAILESLEDAVMAVDRDMRITEVNRAGMDLLGLEREPIGSLLLEVLRLPDLREMVLKAQRGESARAELEWPGPPQRTLLVVSSPQRVSDRCVLLMRDITELRRLENMRREFVANVSHELRTPVSVIQANAETLLGGALGDTERAKHFAEAVHRNAVRLSRLVSDLLDLSRIEAGVLEIHPAATPAETPIGAVMDLLEPKARGRQQSFEVDVEEDLCCQADPKALEQVLVNLVDNAIKYTPEGGTVGLRVFAEGDDVRFEIWDTGPGVPASHRPRLFERFYRVDPGRSREMGGTGLGLSIVKHLVDAMGGRVGMEPRDGGGSVFWVALRPTA